jgi:hypothetical protein
MKSITKAAAVAGALAIAAGAGFAVGQAQADQPHMQNALNDLQSAKGELQAAMRNKGGHRATALGLVNQAIGEVEAGIAAGDGY